MNTMTYKEFKELVPAETMNFVDKLLPLFKKYVSRDAGINLKHDNSITKVYSKALIVMLDTFYNLDPEKSTLLTSYKYVNSALKTKFNIDKKYEMTDELEKVF